MPFIGKGSGPGPYHTLLRYLSVVHIPEGKLIQLMLINQVRCFDWLCIKLISGQCEGIFLRFDHCNDKYGRQIFSKQGVCLGSQLNASDVLVLDSHFLLLVPLHLSEQHW